MIEALQEALKNLEQTMNENAISDEQAREMDHQVKKEVKDFETSEEQKQVEAFQNMCKGYAHRYSHNLPKEIEMVCNEIMVFMEGTQQPSKPSVAYLQQMVGRYGLEAMKKATVAILLDKKSRKKRTAQCIVQMAKEIKKNVQM